MLVLVDCLGCLWRREDQIDILYLIRERVVVNAELVPLALRVGEGLFKVVLANQAATVQTDGSLAVEILALLEVVQRLDLVAEELLV